MPIRKSSRFERPELDAARRGRVTNIDLDIIETILRYRFSPTSELMRLIDAHPDVVHRRLRMLWEWRLINRFAFPDIRRRASEFHYYLDSVASLNLLVEHQRIPDIHPTMQEEIGLNRDANYADAAINHEHMKLGFLKHQLMISRFRFMLERSCVDSKGQVELSMFRQGGDLRGHKVDVPEIRSRRQPGSNEYLWEETDATRRLPVEPDAIFTLRFPRRPAGAQEMHFAYEADRGTMPAADMLRKFRAYYYFVKKHKKHIEAFDIHPIRAVLVETPTESRAMKLMEIAGHPLVSGPNKRAGLFWHTISGLFNAVVEHEGRQIPKYLMEPAVVFDREWALPDFTKLSLLDGENSGE